MATDPRLSRAVVGDRGENVFWTSINGGRPFLAHATLIDSTGHGGVLLIAATVRPSLASVGAGSRLIRPEIEATAVLLRSQPVERWRLARLAREAHLSRSQFGRMFSRAFGAPPIAYLTAVRVDTLALLLRTTNDTVAACSRRVGWVSASHASRMFRRATGLTPTGYRKLYTDPESE